MSEGIQFNEENEFQFKSREILGRSRKPGMVAWLEKKGIVKDERTAQFILLGIIVVCFGLAGILLAGQIDDSNVSNQQDTQAQIEDLRNDPEFQKLNYQEQQEIIELMNPNVQ